MPMVQTVGDVESSAVMQAVSAAVEAATGLNAQAGMIAAAMLENAIYNSPHIYVHAYKYATGTINKLSPFLPHTDPTPRWLG